MGDSEQKINDEHKIKEMFRQNRTAYKLSIKCNKVIIDDVDKYFPSICFKYKNSLHKIHYTRLSLKNYTGDELQKLYDRLNGYNDDNNNNNNNDNNDLNSIIDDNEFSLDKPPPSKHKLFWQWIEWAYNERPGISI